jgi:hypothetical protein
LAQRGKVSRVVNDGLRGKAVDRLANTDFPRQSWPFNWYR